MKEHYHAYTSDMESVVAWDGEAVSAEDAAKRAAEENHVAGEWTVIKGWPVFVKVTQETRYLATQTSNTQTAGEATQVFPVVPRG